MRKSLLDMLVIFIAHLSDHLCPAVMSVLVAADAVELRLELTENEEDMPTNGVLMFNFLLLNPEGRKRMCSQGAVDQLIRWIAKRLLTVRNTIFVWANSHVPKAGSVHVSAVVLDQRKMTLATRWV
jgi:hypothetical protein